MARAAAQKLQDRPLQARNLLLCEGADECNLFALLRADRGWDESHL
jgi:hypothetical protein